MSNLEHLRKDAKRLLKQCRAGDASAIARIRSKLPQLTNLADHEFSRRLQLAHVQHALAREQGAENWASMKGTPTKALENLLSEVRNSGNISGRQLAVAADYAEECIYAACVIGDDVDEARKILNANPTVLASLTEEDCDRIVSKALHNRHDIGLKHLRMFAESGADLGVFGTAGATALHLACWHGTTEVAQFLLKSNTPVNARDYAYGVSPLAWAAHGSANCRDADEDYRTIVRELRAAGADHAAAVNRWGMTPDMVATPAVADLLRGWK